MLSDSIHVSDVKLLKVVKKVIMRNEVFVPCKKVGRLYADNRNELCICRYVINSKFNGSRLR